MKKRKLKRGIRIFLILILASIFSYSTYKIVNFYLDLNKNKKINEEVINEVVIKKDFSKDDESTTPNEEINFEKLKEINNESVGWIKYNQNKINYPIVQRNNNIYYLYRAIDGSINSAGTIFMDYRNSSFEDQNVILYGHNMVDQTMFGSLDDIFKEDFFNTKENNYIEIITPGNIKWKYQIFSYYTIEKEEYYITTKFSTSKAFLQFLNDMKNRSQKDFNIDLNENDKILTLSTCQGTGGTNIRKVVHAKRIEQE